MPVIYVAFDLLAFGAGGGAASSRLLRVPLRERRARLDALRPAGRAGHGHCPTC